MSKKILYAGMILTVLFLPSAGHAFAQYLPSETAIRDVYNVVKDKEGIIERITQEGAEGSGVPYFAADGVIGSTVITAGIFGGIATMLFVRGRKGKYAAQGRG